MMVRTTRRGGTPILYETRYKKFNKEVKRGMMNLKENVASKQEEITPLHMKMVNLEEIKHISL
jgi:hypothetical protein